MDDDLAHSISARLRAARQARGVSLSQLSALTDGALSKSRISNYEQGLWRLTAEPAHILALALGTVSSDYLLCWEEGPGEDQDEERLLLLYRSAPPALRHELIEVLKDLVHAPAQTGQKAAPMDAVAAQRTVAARWPELVLDATTYVNTRRFATWICRVHAEEVQRSVRTLSAMTANPCPACHGLDQRRARSAEREDPHAEQHLALLAASGDARAAEIYRLWLAGETLSEIARRLDITPQAVDQRFAKIRKRLREVGQGSDCR